jgi:hypothetical protein
LTELAKNAEAYNPYTVVVSVGKTSINVNLVVRRSTFVVKDMSVTPLIHTVGSGGSVHVSVELNQFVYEHEYTLKVVGGGGEVGNFCAMDLEAIKHTPYWDRTKDPSEYNPSADDPGYKSPTFEHYLANEFPFSIHIGDTLWSLTGVKTGQATALYDRFDDERTYAQWRASGDQTSSRIVFIPVLEKMEKVSGLTAFRVVSLASFYVQPVKKSEESKLEVKGVFLEYVSPADTISDDPPPSPYYIETSHLVPPVPEY